MNRLDEVFGPFGWRNEFKEWKGNSQLCGISVWDSDLSEWVTKWDGSDDSNMDAVKGGISGAMKRAAVQWGIGRYLYNLDQNRVQLKERGENYTNVKVKVQGREEYIKGYWDTPSLPQWALPEGYTAPVRQTQPPQQEYHQPPSQPPVDDQQALAKASEANRNGTQSSGRAAARVYKLREQLGMEWSALNAFAGNVLGREIKFLKSNIKTEEEWIQIENALKEAI